MNPIVLVLVLTVTLLTVSSVFAEERVCVENRICVFPGDFLTYSGSMIGEFSYVFEEFVGQDRIHYIKKGTSSDGNPYEDRFILDLQNGDTYEIDNPDEKYSSLAVIIPIPVQPDISSSDADVKEEIYKFNNINRYAWVVEASEEGGGYAKFVLDEETGIILEMILKAESEIVGESFKIEIVNTLLDTNIIDVQTKIQIEKPILIEETVPEWIRNTALWWSDGLISDDEFVSGIQFLINQGIIQISVESKSSEPTLPFVPNWIKDTAGWWGTNKVSDDDFLNGIKWLIENGILIV